MSQDNGQQQAETKTTGRVKWFNNTSGYGFITAIDGERAGQDVFVHHSGLLTDEEQYKYLVAGEYVEFKWAKANDSDTHEWQATSIKGVCGGKLMCETHKEQRLTSDNMNARTSKVGDNKQTRYRGGGPRTLKDNSGKEWMLVPKTTGRSDFSTGPKSKE
jgi:CspA family cold shock protein|tara:strand:+ start:5335 stop:5814 length:480 start_codon:yes stop_codon:yes gene_type:complete